MGIDRDALGKNVEHYRKAAGKTQQQLADEIDISYQMVSYIENGKEGASLETMIDLANALDTTLDALVVNELKHKRPVLDSRVKELTDTYSDSELQSIIGSLETLDAFFKKLLNK